MASSKTSVPFQTAARRRRPLVADLPKSNGSLWVRLLEHLQHTQARDPLTATPHDWWMSLTMAVRDRILERMIRTQGVHNSRNVRRVYYLSLEYLMGRLLGSNLHNEGVLGEAEQSMAELGLQLGWIRDQETDMGLGNGGLGRLAACFLDSLATHDYPAVGYGIRYEFGLFRQAFMDGRQVEQPDNWLKHGSPWEIMRPEYTQRVHIYGHVEGYHDEQGRPCRRWIPARSVLGVPYDIPIAGYGTGTVNFLRLWSSRSTEEFDLDDFNRGDYVAAVREKAIGETVSKVLYPNDKTEIGRELRLVQQYFFVSCSLHDIIRRFRAHNRNWFDFPSKVAIQLNDTHPTVAVPELLRILVDDEGMAWDDAWSIVTRVFSYTNHTLLPEALEKWSVDLFHRMLPRHLEIIYEVNRRLLDEVRRRFPGDDALVRDMSLIEEGPPKMVRMAHLAVVGSHAVNGVAALHTELLRTRLFPQFDRYYPGRFVNVTNGVTPRRWLLNCNPRLAELITRHIGDGWPRNLDELRRLEPLVDDPAFRADFLAVKRANKLDLAEHIRTTLGIDVDPEALFDVQIKRLHEYKRQHLNLLHILALYRRILADPSAEPVRRCFIFGAKAAPGYDLAKAIILAINRVGARINRDPRVRGLLRVVFIPNYSVSLAQRIIPAADLSEQISTAGKEASGTGNMKLALNGALTIGTLDGANVEIREEVGDDNIFIFGHTVEQVDALWARGYNPWDLYNADAELRAILDWLVSEEFNADGALHPVRRSLLEGGDPFLVLADFAAYRDCQAQVDAAYRDRERWTRMAILNTARVGKFSSDRSIDDYARLIWHLDKVPVPRE